MEGQYVPQPPQWAPQTPRRPTGAFWKLAATASGDAKGLSATLPRSLAGHIPTAWADTAASRTSAAIRMARVYDRPTPRSLAQGAAPGDYDTLTRDGKNDRRQSTAPADNSMSHAPKRREATKHPNANILQNAQLRFYIRCDLTLLGSNARRQCPSTVASERRRGVTRR